MKKQRRETKRETGEVCDHERYQIDSGGEGHRQDEGKGGRRILNRIGDTIREQDKISERELLESSQSDILKMMTDERTRTLPLQRLVQTCSRE